MVPDKLKKHGSAFVLTQSVYVKKAKKLFYCVLHSITHIDNIFRDFLKQKQMNYSSMLNKLSSHIKLSPKETIKLFENELQQMFDFHCKNLNSKSLLR